MPFYEHVIRNNEGYEETLKYIRDDPAHWIYDTLYQSEEQRKCDGGAICALRKGNIFPRAISKNKIKISGAGKYSKIRAGEVFYFDVFL